MEKKKDKTQKYTFSLKELKAILFCNGKPTNNHFSGANWINKASPSL